MFTLESHCALVIACTLATSHLERGMSLSEIAQKNNIPLSCLEPISNLLLYAGITVRHMGEREGEWLVLNVNPDTTCVCDILRLFEEPSFNGVFAATDTGEILSPSSLTSIINRERNSMAKQFSNRLKRITLTTWAEESMRTQFMK